MENFDIEFFVELVKSYTTITDIAVIMGISEGQLRLMIDGENKEIQQAYKKTKALCELELRKEEIELAKDGSPLAIEMVHEYIKKQNRNE